MSIDVARLLLLEDVRVILDFLFPSPSPHSSSALPTQDPISPPTHLGSASDWARWLGYTLWLWLCLTLSAQARVLLRIGIAVEVPKVTLGSSSPARILDAQGQPVAEVSGMTPLTASRTGQTVQVGTVSGSRLYLQPTSADGLVFIGKNWYRGLVELVPDQSGLTAINQVGLDDYVSSVVGSEMGHRFPSEALKAQAVAARSYALFHRTLRTQEVFDLGSGQDWQVYKGVAAESNRTQSAARDTSGQVLTYQGSIINAVFHSSSGGHTEDVANVWIEPLPYLKGVPDFDAAAPVFSWSATFSSQELQQKFGGIGAINQVGITQRSPTGRAMQMQLVGTSGSKQISADEFRAALGLRSTMFEITAQGAATTASLVPVSGLPSLFSLKGRGFGHGVGMSQWGAAGLATQGWSFQQILAHYYQGSNLAVVEGSP
ncbi:MAG: SpoIID/LytB domain-containing protein [Cyanobacteriota bacterium]|nr:SpoIID/LytB domain-containing protein [Cyanobacteriota bacterium]